MPTQKSRSADGTRGAGLLIGIGLALLVLAFHPLAPTDGAASAVGTGSGVVAARPIAEGAVISAGDVTLEPLPAGGGTALWLTDVSQAVGRRAALALPQGAPLMAADLSDAPVPGHRLVTVSADVTAAGLPKGATVDVVSTATGQPVIVASARVLDIDPGGSPAGPTHTVVLDCSADAALAVLGAEAGSRAVQLLEHEP